MTARALSRPDLQRQLAALLTDATFVALIPATADGDWAVAAAWDAARAAADGRRVALVDLHLDRPQLDARAARSGTEGIVDAFEFGASLNHVAVPQDPDTLHFIPVGTAPSAPETVWGHQRWERLRRGFEQEGALLLVFAPPRAVPHLRLVDALVVLAPRGWDPERHPLPPLDGGPPVVAVVTDAPRAIAGKPERPETIAAGRRRWKVAAIGALVIATAAAVATWFLRTDPDALPPLPVTEPRPGPGAQGPADTLYYAAQPAAFSALDQAMAYAASIEPAGYPVAVSPVELATGGVWYRVLVGATATVEDAEAILQALWERGYGEPGQGTLRRVPHALEVARHADRSAATDAARALRAAGLPAYIVTGADGTGRVLVGAFQSPAQARTADSLLARAGVAGSLVTRTGSAAIR